MYSTILCLCFSFYVLFGASCEHIIGKASDGGDVTQRRRTLVANMAKGE